MKIHQIIKLAKSHIGLGHAWVGPTSLGNLWTILGLVLSGPIGPGGAIFVFWVFEELILVNFKTAVASSILQLGPKSYSMTFSTHQGLIDCGKKVGEF